MTPLTAVGLPVRRGPGARLVLALLVLVGLSGLAACGSKETPGGSGGGSAVPTTASSAVLGGTTWVLESYQGVARDVVPAAAGANATLAFRAERVLDGSTGCNQFGGSYTVDGQKLVVELGPMTQRACADPGVEAQEAALLALLPRVAAYTVSGAALTLTGGDGAVLLTYVAGLAGLEGTSWQVTGVNNGVGALEGTALTENLTLQFGADGVLGANGGCNSMSGTYRTSGSDSLTITGLAGTMKACSPEVEALEAQFTAALGRVSTYEISGDLLTLRDDTGAMQVTAQRTA